MFFCKGDTRKIRCTGEDCHEKVQFVLQNVAREGVLAVEHTWGYFSEKDGEIHSFDLCEQCYDHLTAQFKIPPAIKKQTEYL